jgi:hypothetical protein
VPGKRSPMRQIREVLRLHHEVHLGERQIAAICLIGKGTVQRYLHRAAAAGLGWPLPNNLDDTQLEKRLFPPAPAPAGTRPVPDFTKVHQELKSNRSVTLQLLWQEYKETCPRVSTTVGSASSTENGNAIWMWCCGRITGPAKRCLSITPATRSA